LSDQDWARFHLAKRRKKSKKGIKKLERDFTPAAPPEKVVVVSLAHRR